MKKLLTVLLLLFIFQYSQAVTLVVSHTNSSCNGACNGTATVTASGGSGTYLYHWSNGATTAAIINLCPGTYSITVSDVALRTTATASVAILQPSAIIVSGRVSGSSCAASCNGSISDTVTGGTAPYSYRWTNGATTKNVASLCAGTYCLVATDNNGCAVTSCFAITQKSPAAFISSANVTCAASCNASASASDTGATAPYSFLWSNGGTTQSINNLCAGSYCVTVTSAGGCKASRCVNILSPAVLVSSISTVNASCGSCNGSASAVTSGGTAPYIYRWSNGAATASLAGLCAGTYCLTTTDHNGCFTTSCATVTAASSCPVPNLSRERGTGTSIQLVWTVACPATSYTVEIKGAAALKWITSATVTSTTTIITGLTANTAYQVRVRSNCTAGTSDFSNIVSFTTPAFRLEENPADNSTAFNVYPNPAQSELHVTLPYTESGNSRILKITNLLGQTVISKIIAANITSDEIDVTDNMSNGSYIITLIDGTQNYNQHIVIAR